MRISLRWLRELCPVTLSDEEIAEKLTAIGLEVEGREKRSIGEGVVAARVVSDHHRQAYRTPQVELDEELISADHDPADIVDRKLAQESMKRALQDLTEEQRHVLSLRFGSDMPVQDVARLLGKSEGAVKQLQARAVAALARKLSSKVVD